MRDIFFIGLSYTEFARLWDDEEEPDVDAEGYILDNTTFSLPLDDVLKDKRFDMLKGATATIQEGSVVVRIHADHLTKEIADMLKASDAFNTCVRRRATDLTLNGDALLDTRGLNWLAAGVHESVATNARTTMIMMEKSVERSIHSGKRLAQYLNTRLRLVFGPDLLVWFGSQGAQFKLNLEAEPNPRFSDSLVTMYRDLLNVDGRFTFVQRNSCFTYTGTSTLFLFSCSPRIDTYWDTLLMFLSTGTRLWGELPVPMHGAEHVLFDGKPVSGNATRAIDARGCLTFDREDSRTNLIELVHNSPNLVVVALRRANIDVRFVERIVTLVGDRTRYASFKAVLVDDSLYQDMVKPSPLCLPFHKKMIDKKRHDDVDFANVFINLHD